MMNNKKYILFAIVFLALFSGCTQPTENSVTPTPADTKYTAEDLFTSTDTKETLTPSEETTEKQDEVTDTEEQETSDLPEYLQPQENIDYVKYDAANSCVCTDDVTNLRSMLRLDPDTGIVYFINQNRDWYIYRLLDDKAECVVELPARELCIMDGTLYFIIEDYNKYDLDNIGLTEGDIYAYTIEDKSIKKIFSPKGLENDILHMRVYEDGIAFYCVIIERITADTRIVNEFYYYYTFIDGLLKEDLYKRARLGWGDYYMVLDTDIVPYEAALWSREVHEQEKIKLAWGYRAIFVEDTLYMLSKGGCKIYNLLTGEQKLFNISDIFKELVPEYKEYMLQIGIDADWNVPIDAVTINKDGIWMIVQFNYLLHLNPETEEAECYRIGGSKYINDLYTDGINLYGTYGSLSSLCKYDGKLVRICTEKITGQDSMSDVPIIAVEYLTD